MIHVKAPNTYDEYSNRSLFLAGSIEMGKAVDWQEHVVQQLADTDVLILNPRRDNWDPTWEQSIENEKFREQVDWELSAILRSSNILFYFQPGTMSPISLLELGLVLGSPQSRYVWICCPPGFHRKGNIDVTCAFYGHHVYDDLDVLLTEMKWKISS